MSLSLDPNWPHHSFTLFPIDLCSNLAVYPIASLSHSIHLLAVCAIFSWCVCQGLLCYISIPLCLSKSLRGTYAQSNRSHHYIHVPLVSHISLSSLLLVYLWLYRQEYPSVSLCVTYTDLCFDVQRCFLWGISPLLSCACFCTCPSICFCLPQFNHIFCLFSRLCTLICFPSLLLCRATLHRFIITATESCPFSSGRLLMPHTPMSVHTYTDKLKHRQCFEMYNRLTMLTLELLL